ncbi:hypothetical protein [Rickettsia endosymbiont of Polydrusus tereticollis]|uniref:hypothetical protein n=1 Tax=Rickettsia endosymbiont of Polydrusus tereticollis TaxID=3066251 RepID=UPI00313309DD
MSKTPEQMREQLAKMKREYAINKASFYKNAAIVMERQETTANLLQSALSVSSPSGSNSNNPNDQDTNVAGEPAEQVTKVGCCDSLFSCYPSQ